MKNKIITTITPKETNHLIETEIDLTIIDVRTEKEFLYEGRLDNSILI